MVYILQGKIFSNRFAHTLRAYVHFVLTAEKSMMRYFYRFVTWCRVHQVTNGTVPPAPLKS